MISETIGGKCLDMKFKRSEDFYGRVEEIFTDLSKRILGVAPGVEILHIGGSSIPGAYTKGDLDIQVRVKREEYLATAEAIGKVIEPNNLELWNGELAIFRDEGQYGWKIDILMTVIGSNDDNCYKFRDLLIANSSLLDKYNAWKLAFEGGNRKWYKIAKDHFYRRLTDLLEKEL